MRNWEETEGLRLIPLIRRGHRPPDRGSPEIRAARRCLAELAVPFRADRSLARASLAGFRWPPRVVVCQVRCARTWDLPPDILPWIAEKGIFKAPDGFPGVGNDVGQGGAAYLSFRIGAAREDGEGAIDLLRQHHAGEFMRIGHRA